METKLRNVETGSVQPKADIDATAVSVLSIKLARNQKLWPLNFIPRRYGIRSTYWENNKRMFCCNEVKKSGAVALEKFGLLRDHKSARDARAVVAMRQIIDMVRTVPVLPMKCVTCLQLDPLKGIFNLVKS